MLRRVQLAALLAILFVIACIAGASSARVYAARKTKPVHQPAHGAPAATYVGDEACSRCHLAIARKFARTSMGRSLTLITPELLKTLPLDAHAGTSVYDQKTNHHFDVHAENGKLYQTEFETSAGQGSSGTEIFRNTHEMGWIIGTGENGFGALLRRGDYLFQAPLSYYTRAARWDLSPGYQNVNVDFNRIIQPGCIYCHSGRPRPVADYPGKYESPAFSQTSVGCENCHGPGSAHVAAMDNGEEYAPGRDKTIVNPAHLSEQLSDDICMGCHQTGDARVLQPGKSYQDFRPAEPLDKTVSIFQVPPSRENPPQDDHVEHYFSMSMSKCFRASASQSAEKQMRCITCHDPHVEPTAAEAPAFYNSRCMSCHTTQSCTAPAAIRHATTPADNCMGCHMPKRDVVVIAHSAITNHRILARPDEPFPEIAFAQTTTAMPDLIHLNAAGPRGADAAPTPALSRLQAYALLEVSHPANKEQFHRSWLKALSELEASNPENAIVQASLGRRANSAKQWDDAESHLQHSLQLDPTQALVCADLSIVADAKAEAPEAVAWQQKAVALDPYNAGLRKTLIERLINAHAYPQAEAEMKKYLEEFPEDDFMRKMLAIAESQ